MPNLFFISIKRKMPKKWCRVTMQIRHRLISRLLERRYPFNFKIRQSNSITGAAMALNTTQTLVVKKNRKFSDNDLKILSNHEIGVNMLTTFNGLDQPLRIFSHGFANNHLTQAGLAVFSEYMSDSLSLKRVKELAYRVLAADSLIKGYSFSDTFDLLYTANINWIKKLHG